MSFQNNVALALDALSIIKDTTPPNAKLPPLEDGNHLRWVPGDDRGFPLKGGYYLFRRRVGGVPITTCVKARVQQLDPALVIGNVH